VPPTYFKTNKYAVAFQNIVESYGVAHYREVNPGVFTIITFPFLFAVMFGDVGHGTLILIFSLYLVLNEEKLGKIKLNEVIQTCYSGRYMLLLMSIFAIYTGLLYNETFSVPIDLCGTNWEYLTVNGTVANDATRINIHRTYEFGVDPVWKGTDNGLTFYNSLKMKLSVVLGVTQMVLGITLSLFNALYFKHYVDIWYEFIPQMIFMLSLFGYLVFLIIYKWAVVWADASQAPFLLNVMIDMFLNVYTIKDADRVFTGQLYVQWVLIFLAVIAVPWMLCMKPLKLRKAHQLKMLGKPESLVEEDDENDEEGGHGGEEPFDFSEIFVKQIIHTIEFVLGAISNTASYLRLWALSLAHAELSEVFWDRILILTYTVGGFYAVWIGFAIWAGVTFGVLLIMESLSAFLHALRLHWVEFQNKFYHGDGQKFLPFSYARLLKGEDD